MITLPHAVPLPGILAENDGVLGSSAEKMGPSSLPYVARREREFMPTVCPSSSRGRIESWDIEIVVSSYFSRPYSDSRRILRSPR
jgi:hypothetical protein